MLRFHNTLVLGNPGCGKTTYARKQICKACDCDELQISLKKEPIPTEPSKKQARVPVARSKYHIEINAALLTASEKKTVAQLCKEFIQTFDFTIKVRRKFVIIQKFDMMDIHQQHNFISLMDFYHKKATFFFTADYCGLISGRIESRCKVVRIPSPKPSEILESLPESQYAEYISNHCDGNYKLAKLMTQFRNPADCHDVTKTIVTDIIECITENASLANWTGRIKRLLYTYLSYLVCPTDVLESLTERLYDLCDDSMKVLLTQMALECHRKLATPKTAIQHLECFLAEFAEMHARVTISCIDSVKDSS